MGVFLKMSGLAVVVGGGSLVALWQVFSGNAGLAGLALLATLGLSVTAIVLLVRDTGRMDRASQ